MGYVRYLGHSAFEVVLDGRRILIDPWLSNPKSVASLKDYTGNVDIVVVTHDHGDHLGEAIDLLKANPKAVFAAIYELALLAGEKGIPQDRIIGGNIGGPMNVAGTRIMLTPALHSAERGSPTGVMLLGKEATIYHAGDTGLFAEMALLGELYKIDIAMLPIGGHFTMDPYQAAKAVEMLKPRIAIPMHYGTFPMLTGTPDEFKRRVEEKGLPTKIAVLKPGEKLEF